MPALVRGYETSPASMPRDWRGPLPDPSVKHPLDSDDGWVKVPMTLLHQEDVLPLGVITWALLRLRGDSRPQDTSYRQLASDLRLSHLTDGALEQRIGSAIRPLLGTWILRRKVSSRHYSYRAVIPPELDGRYAVLRPRDFKLLDLPARGRRPQMEFVDLVNFCRWQLECHQRGWTACTVRQVAKRWKVGVATVSRHRDRLEALGLLEVVRRSEGRLSDLVWLKEAFEPHWELPSEPMENAKRPVESCSIPEGLSPDSCSTSQGLTVGTCSKSQGSTDESCSISQGQHVPDGRGLIRKLANSLSNDDLALLGGASAPPVALVPREPSDASPPAPRKKSADGVLYQSDVRQMSASLINRHPVYAKAKPHFRRAMVARVAAAIQGGVAPGHVDRAMARTAQEGAFDAEMLLLQRALQQARADQIAGMCADCGGAGDLHNRGCADFVTAWDTAPPTADLRPDACPEDPLALLLQMPAPAETELTDDATKVNWLIVELARKLVDVPDREPLLREIMLGLRKRARPHERQLVEQAAAYVQYALTRGRAS